MRKGIDLYLVSAVAVLVTLITLTHVVDGPIRVLFAVPFVLVLPGYALTRLLLADINLDVPQRIVYSIGLSLAITILSGFVLNWTPWGLQAESWVIILSIITILAALLALLRVPPPQPTTDSLPSKAINLTLPQALMFGLSAAILVLALVIARNGASQQTSAFTQFWMLPADQDGKALNMTTTNPAVVQFVQLGINNKEMIPVRYKVQLMMRNIVVYEWPVIDLPVDGTWQNTLPIRAEWTSGVSSTNDQTQSSSQTLDAVLYRLDLPDTSAYRFASISLGIR